MIRWLTHREAVRVEAQVDLRDGVIEGLREALGQALAENARLKKELAEVLLLHWLPRFVRYQPAEEPTVEVPARSIHAPTEIRPGRKS